MEIKFFKDFNAEDPKMLYEFKATVLEVLNEGNTKEKQPIRFKVLMEDSGDVAEIVSWDYHYLTLVKDAALNNNIYEVEVNCKLFREILNLRLVNIRKTENISTKKHIQEEIDSDSVRTELESIINNYVKNPICLSILNEVLQIDGFFTKPAGMRVHHAYRGGLAEHTLGVTKIALSLYKIYHDYCSLDLLVTGAIIHDIGKVIEYTDDNKFSFEGGFNTHITYGISIITSIAQTLNLNVTDPIFIQLIGIVASHHNQLEYGSPSRPATSEAMLVAFADNIDAGMKGALESISNLPEGARTEPIKSLNGARFTVINNKALFGHNHE